MIRVAIDMYMYVFTCAHHCRLVIIVITRLISMTFVEKTSSCMIGTHYDSSDSGVMALTMYRICHGAVVNRSFAEQEVAFSPGDEAG